MQIRLGKAFLKEEWHAQYLGTLYTVWRGLARIP